MKIFKKNSEKNFCARTLKNAVVPALAAAAIFGVPAGVFAENSDGAESVPAGVPAAALPQIPFEHIVGEFRQTKVFGDIGVSVRSCGKFSVRKNRELLWETLKPAEVGFLLSDEGAFQISDGKKMPLPESARPTMQTLRTLFDAAFSGDEAALAHIFKISVNAAADGNGEAAWTLVPLGEPFKSFVKKIELRAAGTALKSVRLSDVSGDETLIEFLNIADGESAGPAEKSAGTPL